MSPAKLKAERIKIRLKAYDHRLIDKCAEDIIQSAKRTGASISGPVPLPTTIVRYTVLRSPHVDKKSREQFEQRTHKRLIYIIDVNPKTIEALTSLSLPAGVSIEIKS